MMLYKKIIFLSPLNRGFLVKLQTTKIFQSNFSTKVYHKSRLKNKQIFVQGQNPDFSTIFPTFQRIRLTNLAKDFILVSNIDAGDFHHVC